MAALSPAVTLLRNKVVRTLLADGKKAAEVARMFGSTKQSMGAIIRRHGLHKPTPPRLSLSDSEKRVIALARKLKVNVEIEGAPVA